MGLGSGLGFRGRVRIRVRVRVRPACLEGRDLHATPNMRLAKHAGWAGHADLGQEAPRAALPRAPMRLGVHAVRGAPMRLGVHPGG